MLKWRAFAALGLVLAWPLMATAQEDPQTAKFRIFATAQMIDNKCHLMSFADRKSVDDTILATMTQLPAVLAVEDPTDYEAYFGAVSASTAPVREELEPLVAQVPCEQGMRVISQVQFQGYADILAHFRISGDTFQETASPQQVQMLQILFNHLNQSLGQNGPQFEQMIEARKAELAPDYTPEQSASMVRVRMNLMNITRAIQAKRYDLRWNAAEEAWGLWQPQENRFARGLAFDDPAFAYTFTVTEGESEWSNTISAHSVIVLPGREYRGLKIMVLTADPEAPAIPGEARLSYGEGWASYRSFESKAAKGDCPMDACFTFVGADLTTLRSAVADDHYNRAELTLYQDHAFLSQKGSETLRERAGLSSQQTYHLDLEDIFPDQDDE